MTKDHSDNGVVIQVSTSVLTIQGFLSASVGETFEIPSLGVTKAAMGLVVNLSRDASMSLTIGGLVLTSHSKICEGSRVDSLGKLSSITLGDFAIGAMLDPLGNVILPSNRLDARYRWLIEAPAPGIIDRQSVFEPLQTGILSIDSMVPIGLGQRELVV